MTSFRKIKLQTCYDSGKEDLIYDFFIPVLECATQYDRIAGFFSSTSLAVAAKGIAGLISNGGNMRLLACPRLSKDDASLLNDVIKNPENYKGEGINFNLNNLEDEFLINHVKGLGWMIANNLLEIKLAFVIENNRICSEIEIQNKGIFHQKIGILTDQNNDSLSFSGSINETAAAWSLNTEEFKVFPSWIDYIKEYYHKDREKFNELWNNKRIDVRVLTLPDSIKKGLIEISQDFNFEKIAKERYLEYSENKKNTGDDIGLFSYQKEAIIKWLDNDKKLLFEMATGTGKTRTAIGAIVKISKENSPLITIIATPQSTLSFQWKREIENLKLNFDKNIIADSSNSSWRQELETALTYIKIGIHKNIVIYTTHATCSSNDFIDQINKSSDIIKFIFIGDECHGLGAPKFKQGLMPKYNYRIGLSATPSRWFDDEGTKLIMNYFGNESFEFSIKDALAEYNPLTRKHFLVHYEYNIVKTSLESSELEDYKNLSQKIFMYFSKKTQSQKDKDSLNRLLEKRANLVKNAINKYKILESILDKIERLPGGISDLIIFVSPTQMPKVQEILKKRNIIFHKITQEEGTTPTLQYGGLNEREEIIEHFRNNNYKVLVAIKCLNEGIDIPTANKAILMSNSTNPREYVQRIGRIIRQSENKEFAYLYDIMVDSLDNMDPELKDMEKKIREKEFIRVKEIAENSINRTEALIIINSINQ